MFSIRVILRKFLNSDLFLAFLNTGVKSLVGLAIFRNVIAMLPEGQLGVYYLIILVVSTSSLADFGLSSKLFYDVSNVKTSRGGLTLFSFYFNSYLRVYFAVCVIITVVSFIFAEFSISNILNLFVVSLFSVVSRPIDSLAFALGKNSLYNKINFLSSLFFLLFILLFDMSSFGVNDFVILTLSKEYLSRLIILLKLLNFENKLLFADFRLKKGFLIYFKESQSIGYTVLTYFLISQFFLFLMPKVVGIEGFGLLSKHNVLVGLNLTLCLAYWQLKLKIISLEISNCKGCKSSIEKFVRFNNGTLLLFSLSSIFVAFVASIAIHVDLINMKFDIYTYIFLSLSAALSMYSTNFNYINFALDRNSENSLFIYTAVVAITFGFITYYFVPKIWIFPLTSSLTFIIFTIPVLWKRYYLN